LLDVWKQDAKCVWAGQGLSRAAACLCDKIGRLVQDRDEREYILHKNAPFHWQKIMDLPHAINRVDSLEVMK